MDNSNIFGVISSKPEIEITSLLPSDNIVVFPDSEVMISVPAGLSYRQYPAGWILIYGSYIETGVGDFTEKIINNPDKYLHRVYDFLEGHYVVLWFNKFEKEFSIITDPIGALHFYYRYTGDSVIFSTCSRLTAVVFELSKLDFRGCLEYAATGTMFENRTFYDDVKKFQPGTVSTLALAESPGKRRFSSRKIWQFGMVKENEITDCNVAADRLIQTITANFKQIYKKYSDVICDLTGGFDSRLVIAGSIASGGNFSTITVGEGPDADISAQIASAFEFSHQHININELYPKDHILNFVRDCLRLSDGELGIAETFGPFLIKTANQNNRLEKKVSLSGTAGETFRGRWWEGEGSLAGKAFDINIKRLVKRLFPYGCNWYPFADGMLHKCEGFIRDYIERSAGLFSKEVNTRKIDFIYADVRIQRWAGRYLSNSIKLIPSLSPLMFRNMMDVSFIINPEIKKNNQIVRRVIEMLNPKLAAMPMAGGGPASPMRLSNIYKFIPLAIEKAKYYEKKFRQIYGKGFLKPPLTPSSGSKILSDIDNYRGIDEILDINQMQTAFLYDKERFKQFIRDCRDSSFMLYPYQLSRMLTLEWTIQMCKSDKRETILSDRNV